MSTWNSRGLRGSTLEELINYTNEKYREQGLALVQKIPTPVKPVNIDQETRHITLAYFEKKSTVDYIGIVQGIPICFDAKECKTDTFSMQNIHEHQYEFMTQFEKQGGISFIIIYFTTRDEYIYLPYKYIKENVMRVSLGGVKNIKYKDLDKAYKISAKGGALVHYLEIINKDLVDRKTNAKNNL